MVLVSARPAALRRYGDGLAVADVELGARAQQLREVLSLYRWSSPDVGSDHTGVAGQLEQLSRDALHLTRAVHQVAAAFERVDALPGAVADMATSARGPGEARRLPESAFERAHEQIVSAWAHLEYLGDVVEDLAPERWWELVWGARRRPPCLGDYTGSGAVRGPDGRLYPLVIPELEIDGEVMHVAYGSETARDPGALGGADPGWAVVDEAVGVARVNAFEPGMLARLGVAAGILAGYSPVRQRWASAEWLATVTFDADGAPVPPRGDGPERLPHDPRLQHRTAPTEFEHVRWGRGLGTVDTLATAGEAYLVASELENPGMNAYRVVFEQHEDGSRRARMLTYQWATTRNGTAPVTYMGFAVDGKLRRKMVTPVPRHRNAMSQRGDPPPRSKEPAVGPTKPSWPPAP
jgi:hypothetical protein